MRNIDGKPSIKSGAWILVHSGTSSISQAVEEAPLGKDGTDSESRSHGRGRLAVRVTGEQD